MNGAAEKKATINHQLEAVLDHQKTVEAARARMRRLMEALADCDRKIESARAHRPSDALNQALDTKTGAEIDQEIARLERTRSGLRRRFDDTQTQLATLLYQSTELTHIFLLAEAERTGVVYVEAGLKLKECYTRLHALNVLLRQRAQISGDDLPQCAGLGNPNLDWGSIWFSGSECAPYDEAKAQETALRIREAGITLN